MLSLVQHKDVDRLSIYANKLKQMGGDVIHGIIREVSLVLAGANPGAVIDTVMAHGEDSEEECVIYSGEFIENVEPLFHSDKEEKGDSKMSEETKKQEVDNSGKTLADVYNAMTDEQKISVQAMIGMAIADTKKDNGKKEEPGKEVKHSGDSSDEPAKSEKKEKTLADVFNTLTDEQKTVVYALIGHALDEAGVDVDEDQADDKENEGGNNAMKHNVFDQETNTENQEVLSHSEMIEIFEEAKRNGSLADTVLQHGITNIDYLFPDAKTIDDVPGFIKREDDWVAGVMAGVHKTPMSRVKSIFANITADEARARGYIKGKQKVDEVFSLLKRTTSPTTVYKKQKLDRDDVIDITDFDVVAWVKTEMRMMLDEEIARAILVGDGRNNSDESKINEQNIRPIWTDDDVYTVKSEIAISKSTTAEEKAKAFIKACIKSRKNYKGSGKPAMYMPEDMLTDCLLLEDTNGRMIYALPLTTTPTGYTLGCRVTDSRGLSTVQTITKSCARYDYPAIDRFDAIRCDSNGNETSSGTKVKVIVKGSWASIGGKNTATLKVGYKLYEDLNFTYQDISVTDGTVDINEILDVILDANENYYFSAMLSDQVNSVSEESGGSSDGTRIFSVSADNSVVELNSDYELDLSAQEQINMKAHGIHLTTSEGTMMFECKVATQEGAAGSIIFKGPSPYDVIHFTNAQVTQDIPVLTADCNNLTSSGKYYIGDNSTNRPVSKNGWLESKLYSTDYCHQTYTTYDGEVYVRTMQAETWGAWSNSTIKTTLSGDNRLLILGPLRIIQGSWSFAGVGKGYQKLCTLEQLKQRFGLTSINSSNVYINVMNGDASQNGLTLMGVQYWVNDGYYVYFNGTLGSGVWMRINYVYIYLDL